MIKLQYDREDSFFHVHSKLQNCPEFIAGDTCALREILLHRGPGTARVDEVVLKEKNRA
jgi:hypothetical protein